MIRKRRHRGLLLILLSGLLALLTLLGVLLVMVTRTERTSTLFSIDGIRARMATRSGMEFAVARLRENPDPVRPRALAPEDDWTYGEDPGVPLREAANVSYHAGEPWLDALPDGRYNDGIDAWVPELHDRNGNDRYDGWSGRLRGTYQGHGETFKLRIDGWGQGIWLNGGFLDDFDRDEDLEPDHRDKWVDRKQVGFSHSNAPYILPDKHEIGRGWNGQLVRMIDNLVEGLVPAVALAREQAGEKRSAETLGTWLISRRPRGGFQNWEEVEQALLEGISQAEPGMLDLLSAVPRGMSLMEFLRPYFTLHAVPQNVIHPNDTWEYRGEIYMPPTYLRQLLGPPELEERAPVHVNTAPEAVLYAAMTDLSWRGWRGVRYSTRIPPSFALQMTKRIDARRTEDPFQSWKEWDEFCAWTAQDNAEALAESETTSNSYAYAIRDRVHRYQILQHHFNPNARLFSDTMDANLFRQGVRNENDPLYAQTAGLAASPFRTIQKNNILTYSTEWEFHPSTGFAIESIGELRDTRGEVRSHGRMRGEMNLFGFRRDSTQADFVGGRTPVQYASGAGGWPVRTAGAALGTHGEGRGGTVTTYPEPTVRLPQGASELNGYIGLASIEETPDSTITFLHHFDRGWDANEAKGDPAFQAGPENERMQTDPSASLWDPENPGQLYADGGGVESHDGENRLGTQSPKTWFEPWEKLPSYEVQENFPNGAARGLSLFWQKDTTSDDASSSGYHTKGYFWFTRRKQGNTTQTLGVGYDQNGGGHGIRGTGIVVEQGFSEPEPYNPKYANDQDSYDSRSGPPRGTRERIAAVNDTPDTGKWNLIGAYWNINTRQRDRDAIAWFNQRRENSDNREPYAAGFQGGSDGGWSRERFTLGSRLDRFGGGSAASILDEFAVYDVPFGEADTVADRRWRDGRFYKWDDAVFRSRWIRTGGGRIRRLYWTTLPGGGVRVTLKLTGGVPETQEMEDERGEPLDLPTWGAVRYEARFDPMPGKSGMERVDMPQIKTAFLDSVTVVYDLGGGADVRMWEERWNAPDTGLRRTPWEPEIPQGLPGTPGTDPGPAPEPPDAPESPELPDPGLDTGPLPGGDRF